MSRLAFHPTHPGWERLLAAVDAPDDDAFLGLDDMDMTGIDEDVACELLAARDRRIP